MFHYKGEDELKFSVRDQSGIYGREWGLCCDVVIRNVFFFANSSEMLEKFRKFCNVVL